MLYMVVGLFLAARALADLLLARHPQHPQFGWPEIFFAAIPVLFLLRRPRVEAVPILLMSAALIVVAERWLFGNGRLAGLVGLSLSLLTALSGFRLRHQIAPMPRSSPWLWLAVLATTLAILWFYSLPSV